jgi:signal transduction histidine kinase
MTRRILLALLAFTAAVLAGAVVPLTLSTISQDRSSFVQETAGMVRADATVAQADLEGSPPTEPLFEMIIQARQAGDGLLILTSSLSGNGTYQRPRALLDLGMPAGDWIQLADQADRQAWLASSPGQPVQPITETTASRVIAAMPVYGRDGPLVGTMILARSTRTLDNDVVTLWVIFGTICAVAMIGAALLAFGLARWVGRPLKGLDSAARRLADGDLAIRARVESGPPELRRLGITFNTMAGRLEALVHGSRAVIADVSHQLRTPLAALRLRLDLLAADTAHADADTGHELAGALDELARLSRLVDGLLAVARAENAVPVPVAVDVAEVANERVAAWHPIADDRDIMLTATPSAGDSTATSGPRGVGRLAGGFSGPAGSSGGLRAGPVLAWMGEGDLEQVLDNLIANALDALSPGHQVALTAAATPAGVRIAVSDNGPGMSAEDRERAFLRFTTMSPGGTGLGLAIVHRLVTSNGGTASLAETPGGGLTVTLDFPGAPADSGGAPSSTASASTTASPAVLSL